jgi:hypothetical protein
MKFPIYESLYFLNRSIEDLLVILEEMRKAPGMPKRAFDAYQVDLHYLRSHATQDVLEVMNSKEIDEMAKLGKQKKVYEDSIRDLDDVYFEVQEREEQRRRQGLPPLIGVLRGYQSSTAAEEEANCMPTAASDSPVRSRRKTKPTRPSRQSLRKVRPKRRSERAS